ncbi:hypothetical protein L7F22_021885 [Adiantum nelumboides]|nr:hypothetical protein [Adiantum nelumboides]
MDDLPSDLFLRILSLLDYRHLANVAQVCRSWYSVSAQAHLWQRLYEQRWGKGTCALRQSTSWKTAFEARDRCQRIGMDVHIAREGLDYFLVHEGRLLRFPGTRRSQEQGPNDEVCERRLIHRQTSLPSQCAPSGSEEGLIDNLLFFLGDLEHAMRKPKRICVG